MKKMLAVLLVCLSLFSLASFAEDEVVIEPIGGTIVDVNESGLLLERGEDDYVIVLFSENTAIVGVDELEKGMYAYVRYNGMMTRSLPPQITAEEVAVHRLSGMVTEITEEGFLIEDALHGLVFVRCENAAQQVAVGGRADVYYNGMMMTSLPGQVNADKVNACTLTGTFYMPSAGGFLLESEDGVLYQINASEELLSTLEFSSETQIRVIYDGILTRSIPAQANALAIIAEAPVAEEIPATETASAE